MAYNRTNWKDLPNQTTPITATNLNKIEQGIYDATYVNGVNVGNSVNSDYRTNIIKGKNLFDGILELGGYNSNGTKLSNTDNYRNANPVPVLPNKTYTTSINGTAQKYVMLYYGKNGTYLSTSDNLTGTFTTPNNCYYVNFRCYMADYTNDFATLKVQLEEGSTATTYESFIPNSVLVDGYKFTETIGVGTSVDSRNKVNVLHSSNLWHYDDTRTSYGVTSTYENSTITLNNTATGSGFNTPTNLAMLHLKAGSYALKLTEISGTKPSGQSLVIRNVTTSTNLVDAGFSTTTTYTFTLSSEADIALMIYFWNGNAFNNYKFGVQLQDGSTTNTYEPYVETSIYVDGEEIYNKPVVLWTNANTSIAFEPQTITLSENLSNYNYYEVIYLEYLDSDFTFNTGKIPTNKKARLLESVGVNYARTITSISGKSVVFGNCGYYATYGNTTTTTENTRIIPYQIIGYRIAKTTDTATRGTAEQSRSINTIEEPNESTQDDER